MLAGDYFTMGTRESNTKIFPSDPVAATYLFHLVESLRDEISKAPENLKFSQAYCTAVSDLQRALQTEMKREGSFTRWCSLWNRYHQLSRTMGSYLTESGSVATSYASMDEFWADMTAQEHGETRTTIWDTYEHGRRRQLERIFAENYGSEAALLLNNGMSALLVALWSSGLRYRASVLTGQQSYFETSQLLVQTLAPFRLKVLRVSLAGVPHVVRALRDYKPDIALLETAVNLPTGHVLEGYESWHQASSKTVFIIDNSVQSLLTRWFAKAPDLSHRLLVVESCVKYLTQDCMAGVIYGSAGLIERCRQVARGIGLLLQAAAFNYLREGEIRNSHERLLLHSRNVSVFLNELHSSSVRDAVYIGGIGHLERARHDSDLLANGVGAPVFVSITTSRRKAAAIHRALLAEWQRLAANNGLVIPVRAGFGWPETTARVYESAVLNQADSPVYLRISIGIESPTVIREYARLLSLSLHSVLRGSL